MLPWVVQWPLWTALLRRRAWAWRPLVVLNSCILFSGIWLMVRMPGYYIAHQMLRALPFMLAFNLALLGIMVILPLWVLLTNRPSGWTSSRSFGR